MPFITPPRHRRDGVFDWVWENVPHHEEVVSGDALLLEESRTDGRLLFLLLDVMGHGPKAASVVDIFRGLYLWDDATQERRPRDLLIALDSLFAPHYAGTLHPAPLTGERGREAVFGRHVVAIAVMIDPTTREVWVAGSGELAPYVLPVGGGAASQVELKGCLLGVSDYLGILPDDPFPERAFRLEPGARLVAFTDGLADARPKGGRPSDAFKMVGLMPALSGLPAAKPPSAQVAQFLELLEKYIGFPWPEDDTTVILWQVDDESDSEKIADSRKN